MDMTTLVTELRSARDWIVEHVHLKALLEDINKKIAEAETIINEIKAAIASAETPK